MVSQMTQKIDYTLKAVFPSQMANEIPLYGPHL